MAPIVVVIIMAALGVAGIAVSVLLIVLSVRRLVVSLSIEHRGLVTAVAIAGVAGSISDLVYAAAIANDNWFNSVCRIGRYCSLFVVLSVPTTLLVNSCGRLIEVRKRTAARRLAPFYCIATGVVVIICFLLLTQVSEKTDECDLTRSAFVARALYVLVLGSLTTIVNYFIYRELGLLCMTTGANVDNRALVLRVRESQHILRSTVLLTAYVTLMQLVLAVLSTLDSVQTSVLDLLNALNTFAIGALLLIALPQYRSPFFGVKQPPHKLEHSRVITEAESVPRIVVIRSPSMVPQRLSLQPPRVANRQRKGTSPFPPPMRHLYDVSSSPSTSFSSTTAADIPSSPSSTVWPAS